MTLSAHKVVCAIKIKVKHHLVGELGLKDLNKVVFIVIFCSFFVIVVKTFFYHSLFRERSNVRSWKLQEKWSRRA